MGVPVNIYNQLLLVQPPFDNGKISILNSHVINSASNIVLWVNELVVMVDVEYEIP